MKDKSLQGLVAGVRVDNPRYPDGEDAYSPSDDFPEAVFSHRSRRPNHVYRAVRRCLADAELDIQRFGTPEWNPLGDYLTPGGRVFLLCNFVYQRRPNESREAFLGKCTHASVIRPIIDYALKAVGSTGRVEFGNAPLQSAVWQDVLRDSGAAELLKFYDTHAPGRVSACDLRSHIVVRSKLGSQALSLIRSGRDVCIDLDKNSLLEEANGNYLYRVAQYDPRITTDFQKQGTHVYALSSRICAADLVISIPKLKTHEKVGITCALKGCVGAVAFKESLAHHRKGAPQSGGDEFPRRRLANCLLSGLSDYAWTRNEGRFANAARIAEKLTSAAIRRTGGIVFGAWSGNDTCWRMALDLARCIAHVQSDGTLLDRVVRQHLVLTDGIIGGEGQGPLKPSPVPSGWLFFARDPFAADFINAMAMGYDPDILPIVSAVPGIGRYGVTDLNVGDVRLRVGGRDVIPGFLLEASKRQFRPPIAWEGLQRFVPA